MVRDQRETRLECTTPNTWGMHGEICNSQEGHTNSTPWLGKVGKRQHILDMYIDLALDLAGAVQIPPLAWGI